MVASALMAIGGLAVSMGSTVAFVLKKMTSDMHENVSYVSRTAMPTTPTLRILDALSPEQAGALAGLVVVAIAAYLYYASPSRKVLLLDLYCFERPKEYLRHVDVLMKAFKDAEYYPEKVHDWFDKLMRNSGISNASVMPTSVLEQIASKKERMDHETILEETTRVCFSVVEGLLEKSGIHPSEIGVVITTLSCYTPTPSLAAVLINRFKMKDTVLAYSLGGMGCSASVIGVDMAKHILRSNPNTLALLVCHENVSNNTYTGTDPSMMVTNALFRMGGAAVLLSNRPKDLPRAKYELQYSLRSHYAANDSAFGCMGVKEDEEGKQGVYLKKEVVSVAQKCLNLHIRKVAPHILPISELLRCVWNKRYAAAPNFGRAFDHILLHCGGKSIIDQLEKGLKLSPCQSQPTRDALYRFGNTSSASTWYVLSRIESTSGVRKGSRIWHLSFGGGFKVNTAVWQARQNVKDHHPCWD